MTPFIIVCKIIEMDILDLFVNNHIRWAQLRFEVYKIYLNVNEHWSKSKLFATFDVRLFSKEATFHRPFIPTASLNFGS